MTGRTRGFVSHVVLVTALGFGPMAEVTAQQSIADGDEFQVNTYTTGPQNSPDVAVAPDGRFVVVWNDGRGSLGGGVLGQRFSADGARSGAEFQVNTYTTGSHWVGSVAVGPTGDFVVVWTSSDQDGSREGVFGQRFSADGSPAGAEFPVNTYTTGPQRDPVVAMDAVGNFVVAWEEDDVMDPDARQRVFGQRFSASGVPLGSELALSGDENSNPGVAVAPSGEFVVVWQRTYYANTDNMRIFGRRFAADGSPLSDEFQVNNSTNDYLWVDPKVAVQSDGDFLVVWEDWANADGSYAGVFARKYAADASPAGNEFQVNTYTTGYQARPSATVSPDGGFVVVWAGYYQDGSYWGVFGRGLRGDGSPVSSEFQVNTYTTEDQLWPVVASDDEGNFVVVWEDRSGQDGDSSGVFGQRFSSLEIHSSSFETGDTSDWSNSTP